MFRKPLAILLACLMLLPCGIAMAEEAETLRRGDYKYTLNDDGSACITSYTGFAEDLTVPAELDGHTVTSIGDNAFFACTFLTSITLPDSVTSIGANPFSFCDKLTQITVSPDHPTLETIDGVLFEKASRTLICYPYAFTAESYAVPQGIQAIGDKAFFCCESLTSITLPDSVTSIGDSAFSGCGSLTSITLPDSLTSISTNPFVSCTRLTQITVSPDHPTLETIDGVLFEKASRTLICYPCAFTAESYAVPQGIQAIGKRAFSSCKSLSSIALPDGITSIGDYAFFNCESLTSITLPDSVTSIGDNAFSYCESLTSITLPDSVTSIGDKAFFCCESLTSIVLPDSVISIGDQAFYSCESLKSITLPDSLTSFGEYAFAECPRLTLTVSRDSYVLAYAKENGIPYTYPDSPD